MSRMSVKYVLFFVFFNMKVLEVYSHEGQAAVKLSPGDICILAFGVLYVPPKNCRGWGLVKDKFLSNECVHSEA